MWKRIRTRIWKFLYFFYYRKKYIRKFRKYGNNVGWGKNYGPIICDSIRISCPNNISIGNDCQFDEYSHLLATPHSKLIIGNRVRLSNGFTHIICSFDEIIIEDDCLIAAFVMIVNGNHGYHDITIPIKNQDSFSSGKIHIKRGCWIGRGACILGGVTIGENSVVGANAVVTESVPPYCVVAGNPAKIVKRYNFELKKWINGSLG